MSSRLSDIGQVNKFFAILRERLLTVIILSCALATIGCNRAESRKLTPEQAEQVQAARQATIATAERLLGRQLSDSEKECIRDDFKDGRVVGSVAPPLSDTLKQKAESLQLSDKQSETPMSAEGMSKYHYLAADGGPHMLLPVAVAGAWTGVRSTGDVMNPKSDYGRACAAAASAEMAVIPVGSGSALVFSDPPMTACGMSSDGCIEVYYLKSWNSVNLDDLISKATAALPTVSLTDSGKTIHLAQPDAFLLFAGDTPSRTAYGVKRIQMPAGEYRVLVGTYAAPGNFVTVYRLRRSGN